MNSYPYSSSESDDAPIYERAWIYNQDNQEMQNIEQVITTHDLREIDRAREEYKHHGDKRSNKTSS